jgi:hypothetical protein
MTTKDCLPANGAERDLTGAFAGFNAIHHLFKRAPNGFRQGEQSHKSCA